MTGGPEARGLAAGALVVGVALGEPVVVLPGRVGVVLPAGVALPAGVVLPAGVALPAGVVLPAGDMPPAGAAGAGAPPEEPGSISEII